MSTPSNSFQKTTKSGKPVINRTTRTPVYTLSINSRIRANEYKLNKGLSKFDTIWANITRSVQALEPVV